MKQFLDVFQNIQQWDAASYIAASAVVTAFGLLAYLGWQLVPMAVQLYADMASMRQQNREGE